MNIETKYNLGDVVVPIIQRHEEVTDPCPVCDGTGRVELVRGGTAFCPESYKSCRGGRVHRTTIDPWRPDMSKQSPVGKIGVDLYADRYRRNEYAKDQTTYMIAATGVGSGTVWNEADLFPTIEDAQAECDARNALSENAELQRAG